MITNTQVHEATNLDLAHDALADMQATIHVTNRSRVAKNKLEAAYMVYGNLSNGERDSARGRYIKASLDVAAEYLDLQ